MAVDPKQLEEAIYTMVKDSAGAKKFKAMDIQKAMFRKFGEDECKKKDVKAAIRNLVDTGKLVYTYFGGSFIEIPHKEGAAND